MRDDAERLRDIPEAIERIEKYAASGRADFNTNELIQTWVVHHIELLARLVALCPKNFRLVIPTCHGMTLSEWEIS
jgi:uncharacterized protein with HEPN domain